ncbi:MAG: glycosyltransferase [Spirochaetales bacterium]|nr:glycosyltransferase [Spirochaetales bacterium]
MKTAIILPAYNEELVIEQVLMDFYSNMPDAEIYVIDNNSKDNTNKIAKDIMKKHNMKGNVLFVKKQGKANAVRYAFQHIDADIYVMSDADLTYPAYHLPDLIAPIVNGEADMVVGDRHATGAYKKENKRGFHNFGNWLVKYLIQKTFHSDLNDIMSGYRAFSKRFVKLYPILSDGFELETEMSIHALDKRYSVVEIPIDYKDRIEGSYSKLSTFKDGAKVLKTIFSIFENYRPLQFFSIISLILLTAGLAIGAAPIMEYIKNANHYITKVPSSILASSLIILSVLSFMCAIILNTIQFYNKINYETQINLFSSSENELKPQIDK